MGQFFKRIIVSFSARNAGRYQTYMVLQFLLCGMVETICYTNSCVCCVCVSVCLYVCLCVSV